MFTATTVNSTTDVSSVAQISSNVSFNKLCVVAKEMEGESKTDHEYFLKRF